MVTATLHARTALASMHTPNTIDRTLQISHNPDFIKKITDAVACGYEKKCNFVAE